MVPLKPHKRKKLDFDQVQEKGKRNEETTHRKKRRNKNVEWDNQRGK